MSVCPVVGGQAGSSFLSSRLGGGCSSRQCCGYQGLGLQHIFFFFKPLQYLLNQGPGQDPRTVAGPVPMMRLKEAAAEGGSWNLDCWGSPRSGRPWKLGKVGRRPDLQVTPLPLCLFQGTFASQALEDHQCSWKTRSSGQSNQGLLGLQLLGKKDLPAGPRFRGPAWQ